MERGKFITFEGIDGAGKTTQIEALHRFLLDHGIEVVRTREPGGTPLGEKIRAMLLNDDMDVTAETLLFFASRAQHIRDVILPAVERGAWVLSDRFTDATYAYQVGAKGYDAENVLQLEAIVQKGFNPTRRCSLIWIPGRQPVVWRSRVLPIVLRRRIAISLPVCAKLIWRVLRYLPSAFLCLMPINRRK